MLWIWVGRESCLQKFTVISKVGNKLEMFWVNVVIAISKLVKNHPNFTHVHSKLHNITLPTIKAQVILRSFIPLNGCMINK